MFKRRNKKQLDPAVQMQARAQLREWYQRPLGQLLFECEQTELDAILSNLFGYHLLQVGILASCNVFGESRIHHCSIMDGDLRALGGQSCGSGTLCALPEAWPIASDCVDVVLLPHVLEFSTDPHQVLREADRVLIPEGHVVILGFNPFSLWALWRLVLRPWKKAPWSGRFFSMHRLKDWLSLLGFDMVYSQCYLFRPPLSQPGVLHKLRFMEAVGRRCWPILGGGYLLVAKKRVTTLTPIKPRWRTRRQLAPADVVGTPMRGLKRE